jgi:hypothetical protein
MDYIPIWRTGAQINTYAQPGISSRSNKTLAQQYEDAYNASNAANNQRYQDIATGYQNLYDTSMAMMNGLGQAGRQDMINRAYAQAGKAASQMAGAGLSGTTVLPTMAQGYQRDLNNSLAKYDDNIRQQQLGMHQQLAQNLLQFMERRDDNGPDLNQLIQLAYQEGQNRTSNTPRVPVLASGSKFRTYG